MSTYHVINYHILEYCNCHCIHCFGKFRENSFLKLEDAKKVIDNVADYFEKNHIIKRRINLAGGEPTLYPHLSELIQYIHSKGIEISIISNGFNLTKEKIDFFKGMVSTVGISIDSVNLETALKIGRVVQGFPNAVLPDFRKIGNAVHEKGMKLKINTVVSKLNLHEDLSGMYRDLKPDRLKLLQMEIVKGVNEKASKYQITKEEFLKYCEKYKEFQPVIESEGTMENSYLMIDPKGALLLNTNGQYRNYGDTTKENLSELIKKLPMDENRFMERYQKEG